MNQLLRVLLYTTLPALAVAAGYYYWMDYRSDYLGHFLGGYGGTLVGLMAILLAVPRPHFARFGVWLILPACLVAIGIGAIVEGSIFRIAKFDEVDFCNQSLGAVLAGLVTLILCGGKKPSETALALIVGLGVLSLVAGFYYAFR